MIKLLISCYFVIIFCCVLASSLDIVFNLEKISFEMQDFSIQPEPMYWTWTVRDVLGLHKMEKEKPIEFMWCLVDTKEQFVRKTANKKKRIEKSTHSTYFCIFSECISHSAEDCRKVSMKRIVFLGKNPWDFFYTTARNILWWDHWRPQRTAKHQSGWTKDENMLLYT